MSTPAARPQPAPDAADGPLRVIYIAGSGRVGSTLLDRILGQVDGVFSVGELCNLWQRGLVSRRWCGCGVPVDECETWTAVLTHAFDHVPDPAEAGHLADIARDRLQARHLPRLLLARRRGGHDEYADALTRLYRALYDVTGCPVIVDSSKSPVYAFLLSRLPDVEVYVVHLVRDPRATAYSFGRVRRVPDFGDERLMARQHPFTTARRWLKWQALTELLSTHWADRYLRLRYEDMMRDPAGAVRGILRMAGASTTDLPFVEERVVRLQSTHSVSGNPNRFTVGDVALRLDDEWRTGISRRDAALVTAVTWPVALRYGYGVRAPADASRRR